MIQSSTCLFVCLFAWLFACFSFYSWLVPCSIWWPPMMEGASRDLTQTKNSFLFIREAEQTLISRDFQGELPSLKLTVRPWNMEFQKGKDHLNQPSIFAGDLLYSFREGTHDWFQDFRVFFFLTLDFKGTLKKHAKNHIWNQRFQGLFSRMFLIANSFLFQGYSTYTRDRVPNS